MADEKLNVSPEENPQPSLFDTGPEGAPAQDAPAQEPPAPENIPEQAAVDAPVQDAPAGAPGEVSVSADQIEKLMAEQRAAGRAEVEKNEPPEPEQPSTPAPEEKAAGEIGRSHVGEQDYNGYSQKSYLHRGFGAGPPPGEKLQGTPD